jgi:hypothetical protein
VAVTDGPDDRIELNWGALINGALAGLLIAGPAGIIGTLVTRNGASAPVVLFFVLVIAFGLMAAGFGAARIERRFPLQHAALAPVLAYVALQVVLHARRLALGEPIDFWRYPVFGLLASSLGVLGGMLANRWMAGEDKQARRGLNGDS